LPCQRDLMGRYNLTFLGWRVLASGLLFVFSGLFASAHCQAAEIAVLIEQKPKGGGEVSGGTGVRYFPPGSEIRLTAIPKLGYQFLYWLGDVADPRSNNTSAHLDGPKIFVAVYGKIFEEEVHECEEMSPMVGMPKRSAGGGGGVRAEEPMPPPPSYGAGARLRKPPAVIPEPSTIFLFGLAAAMLRRKRRRF